MKMTAALAPALVAGLAMVSAEAIAKAVAVVLLVASSTRILLTIVIRNLLGTLCLFSVIVMVPVAVHLRAAVLMF